MIEMTDIEIEQALIAGRNADALRREFGEALYEDLRNAAAAAHATRFSESIGPRRKVLILPGILGSKLSVESSGDSDLVWFNPARLALGEIDRLKLRRNDGVVPSGVFWVAYLKLKLRLAAAGFEVEWAPYDWRKPIAAEAARLMRRLRDSHARDVMLVCHSMGGLVARAMADGDQT
ncbi:MAG: hypothetical protein AAFP78_09005, partial [Pseudomonadota bacterium]